MSTTDPEASPPDASQSTASSAVISPDVTNVERRLVVASLVCAAAAVVAISWATVAENHSFWAFSLWVALSLAAGASGVVALVRLPRSGAARNLRRLATLGTVAAVLCATLGLAVYSSTRADDCPKDGSICTIREPGPGERDQKP